MQLNSKRLIRRSRPQASYRAAFDGSRKSHGSRTDVFRNAFRDPS